MLFYDTVGSSRHCRKKAYVGKRHIYDNEKFIIDFFTVICFFSTLSEVFDTVGKRHSRKKSYDCKKVIMIFFPTMTFFSTSVGSSRHCRK
eukprot:UN15789